MSLQRKELQHLFINVIAFLIRIEYEILISRAGLRVEGGL